MGKKNKKRIWWLPDYYFNPPEKQPGEVNNYSYGDFSVTMCPKCEKAWERGLVGKKRVPVYYDDFPVWKLKEKNCPNCEDNKPTKE